MSNEDVVGLMELRRMDLAELRQCYRVFPGGIEDGNIISKGGRDRLIHHSMLHRRSDVLGTMRTYITSYGIEVIKANS